jgi:nitrilase
MDLFRVAVVQAGSAPFDRERSTIKALNLIGQAMRTEARLIVFPEAFISGYPKGIDFGTRDAHRHGAAHLGIWRR